MALPNVDWDHFVKFLRSLVELRPVPNEKETFDIMLHLTLRRNERTGRAEISLQYPAGKRGGSGSFYDGAEAQSWLEELSRQ